MADPTAIPKRRRKRKLNHQDKRRAALERRRQLPLLKNWANDDETPSFSNDAASTTTVNGATIPSQRRQRQRRPCHLLHLLRQRESGVFVRHISVIEGWEASVLLCNAFLSRRTTSISASTIAPQKQIQPADRKNRWRSFVHRSIRFSRLQTPREDAVLAVERHGSYLLSLTGCSNRGSHRTGTNSTAADGNGNGERDEGSLPVLALRFYGLPSPSALDSGCDSTSRRGKGTSPLLQTVTLISGDSSTFRGDNNGYNPLDRFSSSSSAVTVPIRLLLSQDWSMGVAYLRDSISAASYPDLPLSRGDGGDGLGRLVLFPLARHTYHYPSTCPSNNIYNLQTFQCSNVSVQGAWKAFTMRNLLWKVDCIPVYGSTTAKDTSNNTKQTFHTSSLDGSKEYSDETDRYLCAAFRRQPGHVLFNDEEDGYRITWIQHSSFVVPDSGRSEDVCVVLVQKQSTLSLNQAPNTVAVSEDVWEEKFHDSRTGQKQQEQHSRTPTIMQGNPGELAISFQAYLNVEVLLSTIMTKRKHLHQKFIISPPSGGHLIFPDYFYNLVSVLDFGRTVDLVIAFKAKNQVGCVGLFVRLDLFTQFYNELNWVQNNNISDLVSLRNWCNSLAKNRRMRDRALGPYCINPKDKRDWSALCKETHEADCDYDLRQDTNGELWGQFLSAVSVARQTGTVDATNVVCPKPVSFSSLYPDCELVTNRAVANAKPVMLLTGRRSPIDIVYG